MIKLLCYFFVFVWPDGCFEVDIDGVCHKEIEPVFKLFPAGKTSNGLVQNGYSPLGSDQTIPCPDGKFAYREGLRYPWQCKLCPPGVICQGGQMRLCPVDDPFSDPGAISDTSCRPCDKGFKCYPGKQRELCDVGYKRKSKLSSKPFNLIIGNFSSIIKMASPSSYWNEPFCVPCEPGEYCPTGAVDQSDEIRLETDIMPLPCPEETFNPFFGKASCIPCDRGLGEYCPEGSKSKRDLASSSFCLEKDTKLTSGFIVIPALSSYQCGKGCEQRRFCIGFHWDETKCFIKLFNKSPAIQKPSFTTKPVEEQTNPSDQIESRVLQMNEAIIEYRNYTTELFDFVEIEEDNPVVIGSNDVESSIFGGDEHKVTLLAANFEHLSDFSLINFNNGLSFQGTASKSNSEDLRQFQLNNFPKRGNCEKF